MRRPGCRRCRSARSRRSCSPSAEPGQHLYRLTDAPMALVGASFVDDDLVGTTGWVPARNEVELVQLLYGVPTEPERGCTLPGIADRLALVVDELRVVDLHVALRGLDAGRPGDDALDRSRKGRPRARPGSALVVLERLGAAHLPVGSLVH